MEGNMKKLSLLAAAGAALSFTAYAADELCTVAKDHCKILAEDAKVRIIDYTAKAGDKVPMHSHPFGYVAYIIKAAKIRTTMADGTVRETERKDGEAVIFQSVTHSTEYFSDGHAILVEFKR
jgi:hypothetical protein